MTVFSGKQPDRERHWHSSAAALPALLLCAAFGFAASGLSAQAPAAQKPPAVATSHPQSFEQTAARAQQALEANRLPEAVRLFQQAIALRPTWPEGWWFLGTIYYDDGEIPKAHDAFLHFVSLEHKQPGPGYGMLGLTEFQLKNYKAALDALERGKHYGLGRNIEFVHSAFYHDAILNNYFGQHEIALARLTLLANQLATENPDAPKDAVLSDNGLLDAFGLAALRIPKLPADMPSEVAPLVRQAGHAQALIALQDRTTAGEELHQILTQYPSTPGVHYMYGIYLLKEEPVSAQEQFSRELELSPKHVPALVQMAMGNLLANNYKQGLEYAQKAIALEPDNFVAHVACGRLWLGLEDTDHALRELRRAEQLSPGSPDVHFAMARALAMAGQSQEAAKERAEFERLKALADAENR